MNDNVKIYVLYNLESQKYNLEDYTSKKNMKTYLKEKRDKYVRDYIILKLEADKSNEKKEILHLNDNLLKMDPEICLQEIFNTILVPMQLRKFNDLTSIMNNKIEEKPKYYVNGFIEFLEEELKKDIEYEERGLETVIDGKSLIKYVEFQNYYISYIDTIKQIEPCEITDFVLYLDTEIFEEEEDSETIDYLTTFSQVIDYIERLYYFCLQKTLKYKAGDLYNKIFKTKGE